MRAGDFLEVLTTWTFDEVLTLWAVGSAAGTPDA